MELAGEHIPFLYRSVYMCPIFRTCGNDALIRSLQIIGMDEIDIRISLQSLKQPPLPGKAQIVPSDMWNLQPAGSGYPQDPPLQDMEPLRPRALLAAVEQ